MLKLSMGMMLLLGVSQGPCQWWFIITWVFILSTGLHFISPVVESPMIWSGSVSLDGLSFSLIWLSWWLMGLIGLASSKILAERCHASIFLKLVLVLVLTLTLTFTTTNIMTFYIGFEASLIPTLMLILGWGGQPERLQAGLYLMMYTLLASLPLLVSILSVVNYSRTFEFFTLSWNNGGAPWGVYVYLGLVMAFLVKMPMYLVHLWLPKAHVEAPVAGSMALAGVLLKIGGYGLMRTLKLVEVEAMKWGSWWIGLSLVGGAWVSILCVRQVDMKSLVAYSSVSHMSLVIGGIMTLTEWGYQGAMAMMLAHGLCSSSLFMLVNVVYERTGSRSMLVNRGLMNLMPNMALWWFLFSACNMAAPPSLNLLGEVSLLVCIVNWAWVSALALMIMSFFSAVYSLYLYAFVQHGVPYSGAYACVSNDQREFLAMVLHWIPLNLVILKSGIMSAWIY